MDMVKILYWYQNGLCIWQKRLEADMFRWLESEEEVIEIHETALQWLLDGRDLQKLHKQLRYNSVV